MARSGLLVETRHFLHLTFVIGILFYRFRRRVHSPENLQIWLVL